MGDTAGRGAAASRRASQTITTPLTGSSAIAARNELRRRSAELELQLADVLSDGFEAELGRSVRRIRDAISPYTRFVATERTRLEGVSADIGEVTTELRDLRGAVSG